MEKRNSNVNLGPATLKPTAVLVHILFLVSPAGSYFRTIYGVHFRGDTNPPVRRQRNIELLVWKGFSWIMKDVTLFLSKWNELGFRPPLCTYRLNWTKRTFWWWWAECDTAIRTQDSTLRPWRSEVEHTTSRSRSLPTILNLYQWATNKHLVSLKHVGQSGARTYDTKAVVNSVTINIDITYMAPILGVFQ